MEYNEHLYMLYTATQIPSPQIMDTDNGSLHRLYANDGRCGRIIIDHSATVEYVFVRQGEMYESILPGQGAIVYKILPHYSKVGFVHSVQFRLRLRLRQLRNNNIII